MSRTKPKNLEEVLLPYQQRFIRDRSRFKIWTAARQIGKSTALAFEAVEIAASRSGACVLLVSASQRQSRELLERVRRWTEVVKLGVDDGVVGRETVEEIALANGSRIISLPANSDTVRGFSGHIFLDEFAFHRDAAAIWAAVFPIATRGFSLRVVSTPNGRQDLFYRIWAEGGDAWSRHRTSIHDAAAQGLAVDIDELRAAAPDEQTWRQEYECIFLDEATAFLTWELIAAAEHNGAGRPQRAGPGPFYIGADIGRRRDLTVYFVVEKVGDVFWTRQVETMRGARFIEQDAALDALVERYRPVRICLDQSGLGEKVVEDARRRFGGGRVEGVVMTGPAKQDLAGTVRRLMEDRRLRIPPDPALRDDLHSIRRSVTSSGAVRFDAARRGDGHADRFWALALALHAAADPGAAPEILSANLRTLPSQLEAF